MKQRSVEWLSVQIAFVVFALCSFFLRHRGLSFFDASDFATAIQGAGLPHAPGYPLYVLLGKLFNFFTQDPFEAQFWLNIFAAGVTANFLFLTLAEHKKSALLAVLFLFSQSLFQTYVLIPEVFTLNLALVSILIYFHKGFAETQDRKYIFGIGLLYGLGVCHHHLMALFVPASFFLLFQGFQKSSWRQGVPLFVGGFSLGLLPLVYFFTASALNPEYTYYSVSSLQDLLFVVLRQGYGTFKMTSSADSVAASQMILLMVSGMAKSMAYLSFLLALLFLGWCRGKNLSPASLLSVVTVLIFVIVFCTLANFPVHTIEGKNAFLRYLSLPCFLLLYPFAEACSEMNRRWGNAVFAALAMIALAVGGFSFSRLDYRHDILIEHQVHSAFQSIHQSLAAAPQAELDPRYGRCVIFALTDPFHFGGRYYNEFRALPRCYFYSLATVITGQFQARAEEILLRKYLGTYSFVGKTRESIFLDFFQAVLKEGYRVFFISPEDLETFQRPELRIAPLGGVVELLSSSGQVSRDLRAEYVRYLMNLKLLLDELEKGTPPPTLSEFVVRAPFVNLRVYSQLVRLPEGERELEREVLRRSEGVVRKYLSSH